MKTFATMFSGGGLADVGLCQAGLDHAWGIELDAKRAAVARANGFDVRVGDVLTTDPKSLARVDWLHASPPCDNFSQANGDAAKREGGRATELDLALALSVADYVRALEPEWVSLENVMGWRETVPEQALRAALIAQGYRCAVWLLDAADFGTPQSRRRVFSVFGRSRQPRRPPDTHSPTPDFFQPRWVGWDVACQGWEQIEPRPLVERMARALDHAVAGVVLTDTRYKGAVLVQGGAPQPHTVHAPESNLADDLGCVRLPIYRHMGEPSTTLTRRSAMQILTPDGARTITERHIARICGLPDSWITPDTLTMTREVCGLGVCPPVIRAIVQAQDL